MPPLRLIAVDIDGTLLDSQFRVSDANLRAINDAHESGIHIVLATGRRHAFTRPITSLLGFSPSVISSNGAVTRDANGMIIAKTLLPKELACGLLDTMQAWSDQAVVTMDREGSGAMYVQSWHDVSARIQRWVESNRTEISEAKPLQTALTEDPLQMMFCGNLAEMAAAREHLDTASIRHKLSIHTTQYDERDLCIIDVMAKGVTKGRALAQLCATLHVRPDEVLAIGDNYNDVEMLEFAGHSYIVENAHEQMKVRGWIVTRSNDDDGVAHAIASALETAAAR